MGFKTWADAKLKQMSWVDLKLTQVSAAFFFLMLAKLWEPLLSLDWYWYAVIFLLALIKPTSNILLKCQLSC